MPVTINAADVRHYLEVHCKWFIDNEPVTFRCCGADVTTPFCPHCGLDTPLLTQNDVRSDSLFAWAVVRALRGRPLAAGEADAAIRTNLFDLDKYANEIRKPAQTFSYYAAAFIANVLRNNGWDLEDVLPPVSTCQVCAAPTRVGEFCGQCGTSPRDEFIQPAVQDLMAALTAAAKEL